MFVPKLLKCKGTSMKKNKHIHSLIFIIMLTANFVIGGNLLKNGGFEKSSETSSRGVFCQDWPVTFGSKSKQCSAELSSDAYKGRHSLKLILKGPKKSIDVWTGQKIKVTPGTKLGFKLYVKGTKGLRFYIQFMPMRGKKYLKSTYIPYSISPKWTEISGSYVVPEDINYVRCLIHMVGRQGEGYFDEFGLSLAADFVLSNKNIAVTINPLLGGCIDSFIDKKDGFNYTRNRQPGIAGGMGLDILPGIQHPGAFANNLYKSKVIVPYKKIQVSRTISSGNWKGVNICKTYNLPSDDKAEVNIEVNVKNNSAKTLSFIYRVQNVINPVSGVFSYPSRDWLTVFNRTPESIRTINSLVVEDMRAGWCAKKYKNHKTLLFKFNNKAVYKIYNYLVKEFDTMEWYYRKITLKPNENWQSKYSIMLINSNRKQYSGKLKYKTGPVHIKGIKLAAPKKTQKKLPAIMQGYFPYSATLTSMVIPEAAGSKIGSLKYLYAYQRQVTELADNYFNNFYFVHLFIGSSNLVEPLGEEARHYNMTMTLNMQTIFRKDVNVKKFSDNISARIKKRFRPKELRNSIKKYKDLILCYYTADELSPSNINCMVLGHDALRNEIDPDGAFFPYLNLGGSYSELAKYLPVYLGDYYPIYGKEELLRNPWSVATKIKNAVKMFPDTPIWFMPQGFATNKNVYSMPTHAEIRLMVYSAVSQGAKGIIFFGLNHSSFWLVKAGSEEIYSITSAEGARLPQWKTIGECGRELTAIGPRLFYTKPEWNYKAAKITCSNISKISRSTKVYKGPAITISSLKHKNKKVRYLLVVNQDDTNSQSGILSFRGKAKKSTCYDLTQMKSVKTIGSLKINLEPGDARFFILGSEADIKPEIEQIFTNRYQREKARYVIASERAEKNGVKVDSAPGGSGESAYKAIIAAQQKLYKKLERTEFGKSLKQWQNARKLLSKIDSLVRNNIDSIIPPAIREKTPNFRKFPKSKDPALRALMTSIEQDFFNYWKFDRAIENGEYKKNKKQIEKLIEKTSVDYKGIMTYIEKLKP